MREIKFRAWNGEKIRGIEKNDFFSVRNDGLLSMNLPYEYEPVLMQYTGLKDKNDRAIYEGDILTPFHYKKTSFANCIVTFRKGMFCFDICKPFITKRSPLYHSLNLGKRALNSYEVIGNIYEKPRTIGDTRMKFDPTKPVQSKNGIKVRIVSTDGRGGYPIAAWIQCSDRTEKLEQFTNSGIGIARDLINIPGKYVNIYRTPSYMTRAEADDSASPNRIACVRIEFEEGQFDE